MTDHTLQESHESMPDRERSDVPTHLALKISHIMAQVQRIPKNGYNDYHQYQYVTEADVTDTLRGMMADAHVVLFPEVLTVSRTGELTTVWMRFTLIDADSGERHSVQWPGEGQDKNDKGIPKAITAATKYFLLKTFQLSAGDDPEGDSSTDSRTGGQNGKNRANGRSSPSNGGAPLPTLPTTPLTIRVTRGALTLKSGKDQQSTPLFRGTAMVVHTGETFPISAWRDQGQFLHQALKQATPVIVTVAKVERYHEYQVKTVRWPEQKGASPNAQGATVPAKNPAVPEGTDQPAEPKLAFRQEVARLREAGWTDAQIQPAVQLATGATPFNDSPEPVQRVVLAMLSYLPSRWPQVTDAIRKMMHGKPVATLPPEKIQALPTWIAQEFDKAHPSAPPAPSDEVQL